MSKQLEILEIQDEVLRKLVGRVSLLQGNAEKEETVMHVLTEVCGNIETEERKEAIRTLITEEDRKKFVKELLSYGVVEEFFHDPAIEDVIINSTNPIFVHHSSKGLIKTDKKFNSLKELDIFVKKLIILAGKKVIKEINDVELPDIRGRVNIVHSPFGPQITITRMKERPLSIIDLVDTGALTFALAAQLWMYVEGMSIRPANLLVVGAPGSGKSTLLNALFSFVPENERIVVIEDTLELNTEEHDNCSRLVSDADVTLEDLVIASLRMRPDRVVVGEVRGPEAQDLMTAMNIGKYCMCTLHANSAREAIIRLQNEPMNIPESLVNLIDVFVILKKVHMPNKVYRVVEEVAETAGLEQKIVLLSEVWKYNYDKQKIIDRLGSTIHRDKLAVTSGISSKEVVLELKVRSKVLELLKRKNITKFNEVTRFCQEYNKDPNKALGNLGTSRDAIIRESGNFQK